MRLVKAAKASPHAKFYNLSTAYDTKSNVQYLNQTCNDTLEYNLSVLMLNVLFGFRVAKRLQEWGIIIKC